MHLFFRTVLLFLLSLCLLDIQAQTDSMALPTPYPLDNPRNAVSRHLYYLNNDEGQENPALAAEALSLEGITEAERLDLSLKLKQIFDAKGTEIKTALIPDNADYVDSIRQIAIYQVAPEPYPELFVKRNPKDGKWRYAPESVAEIEKIHKRVVPSFAALLQDILPGFTRGRILGVQIWQYLGLILIGFFSWLIYRVLMWAFDKLTTRVVPWIKEYTALNPKLVHPVTQPLSLYLITWLLREVFIPALILPISVSKYLILILTVIAPIVGVIVFYRLIDLVADLFLKLAGKTDSMMDDQAVPLIARAAKLVVVTFGLLFVLQGFGVNVTALLAGVSIGGLAVALAAQETVRNFIGSLTIFSDRPFVVGDFIETSNFSGVVVEVGVRSSRVRALDGAQITVPNGKLVDMIITNHGVRTYRRYATSLGVTYDTSPDILEAFVDGVKKIATDHELVRTDSVTVQFHEMADSSLNIFFAAIYETQDYGAWLKARQEVFLAIMRLAEEKGVNFAFPSTSVYIESMPEAGGPDIQS
ncbi:MAG: mechanosensitive ion channel family protein [Bacteroidota bacterium]